MSENVLWCHKLDFCDIAKSYVTTQSQFVLSVILNELVKWHPKHVSYGLWFHWWLFILWRVIKRSWWFKMSRDMTKPTVTVRPAKTQISLGIHPVWLATSLCAYWVAKDPRFLHADSEDSDQTGRMPRLIWVFARRTLILLVLSCRGSNVVTISSSFEWSLVECLYSWKFSKPIYIYI